MSDTVANRAALQRLFERENAMLVRFLTGLTRCRSTAEDVAQIAWLKLFSALQRGVCPTAHEPQLRAYLFEVARNTFIDECTRKHEAVRTRATDPCDLDQIAERQAIAPSAEDELMRFETHAALTQAMEGLPDAQREVVVMWCAGETTDVMARRSAAPYDTVLSRKKYAFARMRSALLSLAPAF